MIEIENLEKLNEFEISYLKNFEARLDSIYSHEKAVLKIVSKLNKFVKEMPEESSKKEIIKTIEEVKKKIIPNFKILKEETKEEELIRIEREKKKDLLDIEKVVISFYNSLQQEAGLLKPDDRAYKKISRTLRTLKSSIEEEERGITLNEHIFLILNRMHTLKEALNGAIKYEIQILESAEKNVNEENIEEIEKVATILIGINKQIKGILRTEKYEVYKPIMAMILKEVGGAEQFKKIKEKGIKKITFEDIKKDIFTMTDAEEILKYISALEMYKDFIEEKAIRPLENYRIKAREIVDKQKREHILDPLMHIFTRKFMILEFDNLLFSVKQKEKEGILKEEDLFSFILLDIDHFKIVNDTFGHPEGDRILKEVAKIIKKEVRSYDLVCRYGGEEIAVIMPRTTLNQAAEIAKRVRKAIESNNFNLADKRPITISGGVSMYGADGVTKEDILKTADERLYKAKKAGRNRIVYD